MEPSDAVPRRLVPPGNNSWAQRQQQREFGVIPIALAPPEDRGNYENKPMPPLPSSQNDRSSTYLLPARAYVPTMGITQTTASSSNSSQQTAAIMESTPSSSKSSQKARSVTDPSTPKTFLGSAKQTVSQLTKKFSKSNGKGGRAKEGQVDDSQDSPNTQSMTDSSRSITPTPAPTVPASNLPWIPQTERQELAANPLGQIQPIAMRVPHVGVPTKRYLMENRLPITTSAETSTTQQQHVLDTTRSEMKGSKNIRAEKSAGGSLTSARVGMHTNVGEGELVGGSGMHHVTSFRGVIEDPPTRRSSDGQMSADFHQKFPQSNNGQDESFEAPAHPSNYSPSNYGGVWENDPSVVSNS